MKIKTCTICLLSYAVEKKRYLSSKYCSMACYGKSKVGVRPPTYKMIEKRCLVCSKSFLISPHRVTSAKYCSRECTYIDHGKKVEGSLSHLWRGGTYKNNHAIRMGWKYGQWRKAVYKRDNYTCQICGHTSTNLRANHIKRFCEHPELRFVLSNGIIICKNCDIKHVLYREPEWESYFNFNLLTRSL